MNTLILNRENFSLPQDGWYQIAPLGEFPHSAAGVVQVVDAAACETMASRFREDCQTPNFAGLLVDFDHFSLDQGNKSEAAKVLGCNRKTLDRKLQRYGALSPEPAADD